jgi:hypothetical protein
MFEYVFLWFGSAIFGLDLEKETEMPRCTRRRRSRPSIIWDF